MKYNFDEIIDRAGTHSIKWDLLPEGAPSGILPLWVADMDFACPEPVLAALHRRVDRKIFGYTINDSDRVNDAICAWFKRRYDWDIDKSWIHFSPGVVPACALLINALTVEGDGVIIQRPVYYPFSDKIAGNKRVIANSPLVRQGSRYVMDFEDLERKFADPKNKGMILCSPHNPVGRVWTEEELIRLAGIARKYDKWIISDEIHCDLTRIGITHLPLLKVANEYRNRIISLIAPSKTFNMAGMKFSSVIIPNPEYREKWIDIAVTRTSTAGGCSPLGLEAAVAAYTEGEEWLEQLREYIDGNIKYISDFIKENLPKAGMIDCEGTYLVWIDLMAYCKDHKKLEQAMIHDARIYLDEGYIFGEEGSGYERINVASPRSIVVECMERLKTAVLKL